MCAHDPPTAAAYKVHAAAGLMDKAARYNLSAGDVRKLQADIGNVDRSAFDKVLDAVVTKQKQEGMASADDEVEDESEKTMTRAATSAR